MNGKLNCFRTYIRSIGEWELRAFVLTGLTCRQRSASISGWSGDVSVVQKFEGARKQNKSNCPAKLTLSLC